MKKSDLRKLALMGLSAGLLIANQLPLSAETTKSDKSSDTSSDTTADPNDGNLGYHMMTEDELLLELNPQGVTMYKSLTPEGKQLALKVASMRCNKSNECAGLNACQTDKNPCAGKGKCKGQGKCAIADKNLAVKLVKEKMDKKRANAYSE